MSEWLATTNTKQQKMAGSGIFALIVPNFPKWQKILMLHYSIQNIIARTNKLPIWANFSQLSMFQMSLQIIFILQWHNLFKKIPLYLNSHIITWNRHQKSNENDPLFCNLGTFSYIYFTISRLLQVCGP